MLNENRRILSSTIQTILYNRLSNSYESAPNAGPYRNISLLSDAQVRHFPDGTRMYTTVLAHQGEEMKATVDLYGYNEMSVARSICTFKKVGESALTISNLGPDGLLGYFAFVEEDHHVPLHVKQLKILRGVVLYGLLSPPYNWQADSTTFL